MKIAIILPAYNEELTIKKVISDFFNFIPEADIYVIDNNSKDKTNEIATQTIKELGCNGKVFFEDRQGKAYAVRKGFSEIDADIYVMVDADDTYPAEQVRELIKPVIEKQADMVVGDRLTKGHYFKENKRRFHSFGNNLVIKMINFLFKSKLKDVMSGYRVFSRKFIKNLPILTKGFELETEISLHALDKNFKVIEIPVEYRDRMEGSESKLNTFSDGIKVLKMIFKIFRDYKSYGFYTLLSGLCLIFGLVIGFPVIIEFFKTHFIKKIPSAVLATGFMIFSAIFYSIGLILNTIVRHFKADYEIKLNNYKDRL